MATVAVLAQSLVVATLRIAQFEGYDAITLICAAPDRVLSSDAINAMQEFIGLLEASKKPETTDVEHCSDCLAATFSIIENLPVSSVLISNVPPLYTDRLNPAQFAHKAHGPPVGGRAPPTFI